MENWKVSSGSTLNGINSQAEALSRVRWIIENRYFDQSILSRAFLSVVACDPNIDLGHHLLHNQLSPRALPSFSWLPGFLLFMLGIAVGVLVMVAVMLAGAI